MITVSILINGQPLFTRSAHRRTRRWAHGNKDAYLVDTGEQVFHDMDDGAVKLAIKLLKTIREQK